MARREQRPKKRRRSEAEISQPLPELSLEEILEEYRAQQLAEAAPEPLPEPEMLTMEPEAPAPETPEVLTAEVTTQESEPEPVIESAPKPEARVYPATDTTHKSSVALSAIEGYDEQDDFYAGASEETAQSAPTEASEPDEEPEEEPDDEDTAEDLPSEEDKPFFRRLKLPDKNKAKAASKSAPRSADGGLWGKLVGLLALASLRSEQRKNQPPPEPEDLEAEMEPRKAARHYAGQMPSIRLRAIVAGAVCLLLLWITLSFGFGWPLPGGLLEKGRAAALVCLAGQITVMLLGLDIVTSGVMSLLRGRPGAESLIVLAGLGALLDTAAVAVTGNVDRGLPYTVLSSVTVVFALWGAWLNGRGYYDSFMTSFHIKEPTVVTSEEVPELEGRGLISSRRSGAGFIRRSEEPGPSESLAGSAFFPMAGACLALALALSLGGGDLGAFFHIFSLLTGLCASFGWLFTYPLLFAKTARYLLYNGAAIAGWYGARQIGESRRLVLTDKDIFPEDTVEITGIRVLNKTDAERVISLTGSMLATAGTGSAAVFTELMRQQNAALVQVEDFTVGEGGAKGTVGGAEVRVGTLGFMHLSGVKVPDRLKEDDTLYTAIDGELSGVFRMNYRPTASVQRALYVLRRGHRKPIFAVRDFNIDPLMLQREFDVSTEGFRFPSFPERYTISGANDNAESPPAGLLGQEGLEPLVELYECGTSLYLYGRVAAWASLGSAILGAVLCLAPCWTGNWAAVSAARMLLYMLLWLLPGVVSSFLLKK